MFDSDGNVYGTTWAGGSYGIGVVFKLTPNSNGAYTETVLHSFKGADGDGALPASNVMLDASGNIFGTTVGGGVYYCLCGTVFQCCITSAFLVRNKEAFVCQNVVSSETPNFLQARLLARKTSPLPCFSCGSNLDLRLECLGSQGSGRFAVSGFLGFLLSAVLR